MKRGISPLIGSVLLVMIVVIVSILLATFYQDLVGRQTSDISEASSLGDYCFQGVNLEIVEPCDYLNQLSLKIRNRAPGEVVGFLFNIQLSNGTNLNFTSSDTLSGIDSARYNLDCGGDPSLVDKIFVIPLVDTGVYAGECPSKDIDLENLFVCCLDLDGDFHDSCDPGDSPEDDGHDADCNESNSSVWKMWHDVYFDWDNDGAYSAYTSDDYCGPDSAPSNPLYLPLDIPIFSLTPGADCLDTVRDCDYAPHDSGAPNVACLNLASFGGVYRDSLVVWPNTPNEQCFDDIDNNCNGQYDIGELGAVCYPNCPHGTTTGSTPCWCGSTVVLHSSSCRYCCGGTCLPMDCVNIGEV